MLELLSPAGDLECLMSAVDYGCDAVYLGSTMFGMRAGAAKFDPETLRKGVEYAHAKGARVYLTCNTVPSNDEIELLPEFIKPHTTRNRCRNSKRHRLYCSYKAYRSRS